MARLRLDLQKIFAQGEDVEGAISSIINEAIEKRIILVEISLGRNNEHLKKNVLRFLAKREMKCFYQRLEKDNKKVGRVSLHFRHANTKAYH